MASITDATDAVAGTYIADITGGEDRARHSGLMSACSGMGMVASPIAGGLLDTISSYLTHSGDDGESLWHMQLLETVTACL